MNWDIPGRKEIVTFFYLYAIIEALAIFLDSGIIPTASSVYPVRTQEFFALNPSAEIHFQTAGVAARPRRSVVEHARYSLRGI